MVTTRRTPSQERGHATQSLVLKGAARVFDQMGYGKASLSAIAEASGISQGAMYFHFKSKEQIALAVIHEQHARSMPLVRGLMDEDAWVIEKLIRVSRGMVDQLQHDAIVRAGMRLVLEDSSLMGPASGYYADWISATTELLKPSMLAGDIVTTLTAAELARALIGFFTGVQMTSQALTSRRDLLDAVAQMWKLLIAAIVPTADHQRAVAALQAVFPPKR